MEGEESVRDDAEDVQYASFGLQSVMAHATLGRGNSEMLQWVCEGAFRGMCASEQAFIQHMHFVNKKLSDHTIWWGCLFSQGTRPAIVCMFRPCQGQFA